MRCPKCGLKAWRRHSCSAKDCDWVECSECQLVIYSTATRQMVVDDG